VNVNDLKESIQPVTPIWQTLSAKLSWSHICLIMRVKNADAREYYIKEAAENTWKVRTLDRNISTLYYERLLKSQTKEPVIQEMKEKTQYFQSDKFEFIKNPFVLEFLNLPAHTGYTEAELEKALIDNLQRFMLELPTLAFLQVISIPGGAVR
jgi:predicted nuclease of restriction endonuclease-like (RecB) superfamily